uniref:Mitochondrial import receptor subunit TOM7 homolog n=1 Tax=Pygocentrus nattereri TaxID=42514 RepID=A0AAR2JX66_PYGNA
MAKLSKETKQRLQQVFQCGQFVIRWGFIPTVLYLGFKRGADPGMPEPTVLRYSCPFPLPCLTIGPCFRLWFSVLVLEYTFVLMHSLQLLA